MKVIAIILGSIISAVLYRAGGMDKDDNAKPEWIPKWLRHSIVRDIGCSLVTLAVVYCLGVR